VCACLRVSTFEWPPCSPPPSRRPPWARHTNPTVQLSTFLWGLILFNAPLVFCAHTFRVSACSKNVCGVMSCSAWCCFPPDSVCSLFLLSVGVQRCYHDMPLTPYHGWCLRESGRRCHGIDGHVCMRERSFAASPYQAHSLTCAGIAAPRQCCSTVMACARNDADKPAWFSVFAINISVVELKKSQAPRPQRPLASGSGGMSRVTARHQFAYVVHSAVDIVQQESCPTAAAER